MKKKNLIIILSGVVALFVVGLIASHHIDWSVDEEKSSGDIGKSSRFSRKTATESITNMEELLQNDAAYKDGIVTAYVVMQTRAAQFGSLVDMSNEVAGSLQEFADVLKDMNETSEMVKNVCAALMTAGDDLNAALSGEQRPDLAQNTINASLAYTALQKQNNLADRFIEVTDNYLKKAKGDDRLKFVRDQWVDYQQMTAALNSDTERAKELEKKGNLLSAEKSVVALGSFEPASQLSLITSASLSHSLSVDSKLSNALSSEFLHQVIHILGSYVSSNLQSAKTGEVMNSQEAAQLFAHAADRVIASVIQSSSLSSQAKETALSSHAQGAALSSQVQGAALSSHAQGALLSSQVQGALLSMSQAPSVLSAFDGVMNALQSMPGSSALSQHLEVCNQLGGIIKATSLGSKAEMSSLR